MKDFFIAGIREIEPVSKKLCKYVAAFYYLDKYLIALSATRGGVSAASFANITGASERIVSASFSLAFLITTGIVKILLKTTLNKKEAKKACQK